VEELLNSRNTTSGFIDLEKLKERGIVLPAQNKLSKKLMEQNLLPPRNQGLYPKLKDDHVKVVLYVHNRPEYLRVVIAGLSEVEGIEETLLIVSHDGFFEEMDSIVQGIHFCQVLALLLQ
jgi:alpha-1,6-mannosyl-glycoprotein beta-1,2-N-acetylglucosaminyltransferase